MKINQTYNYIGKQLIWLTTLTLLLFVITTPWQNAKAQTDTSNNSNFAPMGGCSGYCNYVANGGFESNVNASGVINCAAINNVLGNNLSCWTCTSWTYDVYCKNNTHTTCPIYTGSGIPTNTYPCVKFSGSTYPTSIWRTNPDSANNNNFIGLGSYFVDSNYTTNPSAYPPYLGVNGYYIESVQNTLNFPLLAGHKYVMKMKAKSGDNEYNYPVSMLRVMGATNPLTSTAASNWHLSNFYTLPTLGNSIFVPNSTTYSGKTYWTAFTQTFTCPACCSLNYVILVNDAKHYVDSFGVNHINFGVGNNYVGSNYIFIDDFSIEDSATAITLNLPSAANYIPDLSVYLSPVGSTGTFAGAGVTYNSTTHLYSYSPGLAGAGMHIITFSYSAGSPNYGLSYPCNQTACGNIAGIDCQLSATFVDTVTTDCVAKPASITATVTGGSGHYSYSWTSTNGYIYNSPIHPAHINVANAHIGDVFTLITYDSITGCVDTANHSMTTTNTLVLNNTIHQSSQLPQILHGYKVLVDSLTTFTVNTPHFTFDSCDVSMGTNAIITVNAGDTLDVVHHSYLHACYHLWNGIYVFNTNSRLRMNTGSKLEDARTGVYSWNGGRAELNSCIFNKNEKHLYIRANGYTAGYGGYEKANLFDCNAPLKPAINPALPAGINKTLIAIEVDSIIGFATIGDASSAANRNTINNAFCGIYSNQSNLFVYNDSFANIHKGNLAGVFMAGSAIYSRCLNNTVQNYLYAGANTSTGYSHNQFSYCDTAIYTLKVGAYVYYNKMSYCANGAHITYLYKNFNAEINNNKILYPKLGIRLAYVIQQPCQVSNGGGHGGGGCTNHVYIQNNTIVQNGGGCTTAGVTPTYVGIEHDDVIANAHNNIDIGQNIISTPDIGVKIMSSFTDYIHDNHITMRAFNVSCTPGHAPYKGYGIYTAASTSQSINCNDIDVSVMPTSFLRYDGIYMVQNGLMNNTLKNNQLIYMYRGLVSDGMTATGLQNVQYIRNNMTHCNMGLMRINESNTGDQPANVSTGLANANTWSGNTHAVGVDNCHNTGMSLSLGTGTYDYPSASVIAILSLITSQWKQVYNGNAKQPNLTCSYPVAPPCPTCLPNMTIQPEDIDYARKVITGQITHGQYDSSGKWMDEEGLYNRLSLDTTIINTDSLLTVFYRSKQDDFTGELYNILFSYAENTIDSAADVSLAAQNAYNDLSRLNTDNICEENLLQVYSIYFNTIAQGNDMNTDDSAVLAGIAYQCPYEGCEGVYVARSLLSMFGYFNFDDSTICNTNTYAYRFYKPSTNNTSRLNQSVSIYPNPSNSNFTIKISDSHNYTALMYNMTGQLVNTIILNKSVTTVDCNTCGKGVFTIKIYDEAMKEIAAPQKIVLIR